MARAASSTDCSVSPFAAPASVRSSASFGVSTSVSATSPSGNGSAGAGLSSVVTPAPRAIANAACVAASGTSHDAITTRAPRITAAAASTCGAPRPALAPGATAIALSPSSNTKICATPLGSPRTCSTLDASMPSRAHSASAMRPKSSAPMRASSATRAPCRAQATAAFEPLPPGLTSKPCASTVSPRAGARARCDTRSAFQLARQTTSARMFSRATGRSRKRAFAPRALRTPRRRAPSAARARGASRLDRSASPSPP
jgi:hypothetical protein